MKIKITKAYSDHAWYADHIGETFYCLNITPTGYMVAYTEFTNDYVLFVFKEDCEEVDNKKSALGTQVSGDHYKNHKIQPVEFIHQNNIPYIEGNVIKYLLRHRDKNGKKDLEKAIHYIQILIEQEYA